VLRSMLGMLDGGVTHLGVATDRVIESFRNDLYASYKTGAGVDKKLLAQFPVLERALEAMGVRTWKMTKYEADDALASAAKQASAYAQEVVICTPDKDLAQCVVGDHVVQLDRRRDITLDEDGVVAKFGVPPASIPDYLALVGDSADGYPGIPGWGAKTAAAVLARFGRIEDIPPRASDWGVSLSVRGGPVLAATLVAERANALLYKRLAILRTNVRVGATASALEWKGPRKSFKKIAAELGDEGLWERAVEVAARAG
jgi:5'-3' exonuclease